MTATTALQSADEITVDEITKNSRDKTSDYSVSRWTKKGDRLYLNDDAKLDKHSVYVDLETGTVEGVPSSTWSTDVTADGDSLTVTVTRGKVREKTVTFDLTLHGGDFEANDSEDVDDPEVATDGGEDVTAHVTDADIETAIESHDDPDHPDSLTVDEVRDLLNVVQRDIKASWGEWMTSIERGDARLVADDADVVVLATGEHKVYDDILDQLAGDLTSVDYDAVAADVVSAAIHNAARRLSDYDWGVEYPLVVAKPDGVREGEAYAVAKLAQRIRDEGTVAAAVDTYALEEGGHTQSSWADATGRNQSSISRNTS